MGKQFKIVGQDMSDGYHTFDELYEHRNLLFISLCKANKERAWWKSDPDFGGWICLYLETPEGQISYHIAPEMAHLVQFSFHEQRGREWDKHTPGDVIFRLRNALKANK